MGMNRRLGLSRYEADEYYKKALTAYDKRQFDDALVNLTEAIALLPRNAEYYAARGLIYLEDGIDDKAAADFEQALRLYPYEMLAHYGRGVIAYRDKKWDEALKHFTSAYHADPKRAETLYYLALVYHRKGENANAAHVMKLALEALEAANDKRKNDASRWLKQLEKLAAQPPPPPSLPKAAPRPRLTE